MMSSIIMLVLMVVLLYFFFVRPDNKKKKELEKMRNALTVGDQVTTIGGIVGTICAVKDDSIVIETSADRVRVEFAKWAVSTKGVQTTEASK